MKKKRNILKCAFGANEIGNMLQTGGNLAQGINGGNQTAQAVFNGIDLTLGNIPVIGKFAKIISGVGKIGTAIAGTKGSVDEVTGEITKGSGILGHKNKGKLHQQSGIVKNNIAAALNSARFASDWYSENGYNGPVMVANGGVIPNTLAYLDDGEKGRTPDGLIFNVPEQGKPTDSNLVNVPVGTQVLSDKLKPKGSKDTYAKIYEKNKAKTNMKGNDKYALNSEILNEMFNQTLYSKYLAMQESNKKGKGKINKYANGTEFIKKKALKDEYDSIKNINTDAINNPITNRPYGKLGSRELIYQLAAIANSLKNKNKNKNLDANALLNNFANTTSGIIGPLMNITAKKDKANVPFTYTPKFGPTDFNIDPLLKQIDNTYSMSNYNMANINPNTGAGMSYGLLAAINRDKQIALAYADKNNQENNMALQNANMYNQWAMKNADANRLADEANRQDHAALNRIHRQGWSDLSTALQTMSKDKRLTKRDMMLMAAMKPYLSKGMTSDQIDKLYSYFE